MEKGSSTGEEMGRGHGAVRQRRASSRRGRRSATDEAEQGARGEGSSWERKTGEKEPLLGRPEATVPCGAVKFDSKSNFKQIQIMCKLLQTLTSPKRTLPHSIFLNKICS
jgi:hypothetical protein